jgi:lipoprotein-anchoring transpeptidase ErfK/SrfK
LGKLESAAEARRRNDLIGARTFLREAWALEPAEPDRTRIRAELLDLAQETILSPRAYDGDPLVLRYVLKPGDTLAKVAAEHKTTADLLASMNRIADKHLVRAGQTIKVVRGPFHAVVDKSSYVLDVMLGETLVRSFAVGLGADDGTPNGLWRVSSKLSNPTYYPPRGGAIMAADDPANPLGERWIGLTGVDGAAVGQERYGIHGTIEPDSIGRSTSMGCIRLNNADVEQLYTYLAEKHSTVIVR